MKIKLCPFYSKEEGTCGNSRRRTDDMRYAMGQSLLVVYCDYDKARDKQALCPYSKLKEKEE